MNPLEQSAPDIAAGQIIHGRIFTGTLGIILGTGLAIALFYAHKHRPDFPEFWGGNTTLFTPSGAKIVPASGDMFWLAMALSMIAVVGLVLGGIGLLARVKAAAWALLVGGIVLMLTFIGLTLADMFILVSNVRELQMSLAFISAGTALIAALGYFLAGNGWYLHKSP